MCSLWWAKEKTHFVITLFLVYCRWWSKRNNSFCYTIICCMLSMMEKEKKLIPLKHYFLYSLYDGAREKTQIHFVITLFFLCYLRWSREKTHSVITLFFLACLWWRNRKNSFCSYVIFFSALWRSKGKN